MDLAVLDTDVASLLHKGTLSGPLATRLIGREPLITFVTFGELAKWAEIRNSGQHDEGGVRLVHVIMYVHPILISIRRDGSGLR